MFMMIILSIIITIAILIVAISRIFANTFVNIIAKDFESEQKIELSKAATITFAFILTMFFIIVRIAS